MCIRDRPGTSQHQLLQVQDHQLQAPTPGSLCLRDNLSGLDFLVDSGADVSVYPVSQHHGHRSPRTSSLRAANGSSTPTFGTVSLTLFFTGLRTTHKFFLADVSRPILGADFFADRDLLIDLRGRRLLRRPQQDSPIFSPLSPVPAKAAAVPTEVCGLHSPNADPIACLLYTSPSPRDLSTSRMPSSA